jgi:hypothetical protein
MMRPHPARGWSHHTTQDHIIEVNGDDATIDAQFVVFEVRGKERPATGWPAGTFGAQGAVTPIEAGYYRPILRRLGGVRRSIRCESSIVFQWHSPDNEELSVKAIIYRRYGGPEVLNWRRPRSRSWRRTVCSLGCRRRLFTRPTMYGRRVSQTRSWMHGFR